MNVALWIAAGVLAAVALTGGFTKSFLPVEKLAAAHGGEWTGDAAPAFVRTLGVLEILAAIGLVLPAVTGIAPVLVPVTAVCWAELMIGAMITHLRYEGGARFAGLNLIYLVVAVFIAWGRFGIAPFAG
ncbi:DoxX family protein [Amycolatopsis tucumanensis]|uniref:DoxX family protein n=1 Tax=Amycolatopsis tucumanensis TaxID=401106 RepID=A0ABP7J988_9PSEU|nr:DoxX family protein [Amycolatopsis tucumanensis]MCF6421737.1 DoxX family protein [Amycolatopsis tucumanensis]